MKYNFRPLFWLNWHWWRTVGCYWFNTCGRCLKPTPFGIGNKRPLCTSCDNWLEDVARPNLKYPTPH